MPHRSSPSPFVSAVREVRLSNHDLLELLTAVAESGGALRTTVCGHSMSPFVKDGDVVVIEPLTGEPRLGDVAAVVLSPDGAMAIHRVVARLPEGWAVRGDNCRRPDGVFRREDFVGRVVHIERDGRVVRLGLGRQGAWVAVLSRTGCLVHGRGALRALRDASRRLTGPPRNV